MLEQAKIGGTLTAAMKTLQSSPKVSVNFGGRMTKGLGLQWIYISNTRTGGDHVPSNISNYAWVNSKVHLHFNHLSYLNNDFYQNYA